MIAYIFSFSGAWPIGAYLLVTASNLEEATKRAERKVAELGYNTDDVKLMTLVGCNNKTFVISEGEY